MNFNKFYFRLFIIIVFLSSFGAITVWSFANSSLIISRYIFLALWIVFTLFFFRYIRSATSIIKDLIINIKQGDIIYLPNSKNAFGKELNELMNSVNKEIKTINFKKEEQYHLFSNAVDHSGSGIIVFDKEGNIELINKAAKKLFSLHEIKNLNNLSSLNPELPTKLISSEQESFIIGIHSNNELFKIAVHLTQFKLKGKILRIASIQDISNELEKKEVESWKKLMHVITHEIMNSVTPMKTLAFSLFDIFKLDNKPKAVKDLNQEEIDDTFQGLKALNNRVNGLMKFVDSYRALYKIPEPTFSNFNFADTLDEIVSLHNNVLAKKKILLEINIQQTIPLFADKGMITQLMINLLKNAIEAVENTQYPRITINTNKLSDQLIIDITDNGTGINDDELSDIFVPFYTTKSNGSGIGLYYSKLIIYMHKGSITVKSKKNKGTTFTIRI